MTITCCKTCLPFVGVIILAVFLFAMTPTAPMYKRKQPLDYLGPLTSNNHLDATERMFENKIGFGPESIAIHSNGKMYTGVSDGRIIEITGNKFKTLAHVGGTNCVPYAENRNVACGRPLGIRIDAEGDLVVADEIKGIYKVNVKSGKVTTLVSSLTEVDGRTIEFADDLVISKSGDIYFSDATNSWTNNKPFWQCVYKYSPDGRILHYDPKSKQVKTLLDNLYFSNGMDISANEDFLLVSQTLEENILKYYLKGPKKGQAEILVTLPGLPDNIRASGRGTYWVAIIMPRVPTQVSLWERLECCHLMKYFVYSSLQLTADLLKFSKKLMPLDFLNVLHGTLQDYISRSIYQGKYGFVLEMNEKGEILRSLHSPKGSINLISEAREHQGTLYLASVFNPYMGKLKLQ